MWSLIMEPGKKYITVVDYTFNLSMAILDLETVVEKTDTYTVYLETEDTPRIILCHLSQALNLLQVKLDLVFPRGTTLKLYATGSAQIHMTGYLLYDEETTVTNKLLTKKYNNHKADNDIPHELESESGDNYNEDDDITNEFETERGDKRKADYDLQQTESGRFNKSYQSDTHGNHDDMAEQLEKQHVQFLLNELVKDNSKDLIFGDDHDDDEDEPVFNEEITTQKTTRGNEQKKTKNDTSQEKNLPVKKKANVRFKMTNELKNLIY